MPSLPTVGQTAWGQPLNDYLSVEHNTDGTHKRAAAEYDLIEDAGCVGDGVSTGDAAKLQAAFTSYGATHLIVSPPGKTYLLSSAAGPQVTVDGTQVDFRGSAVKAPLGAMHYALNLLGDNIVIKNLVVNGNRTAGAQWAGITNYGDNNTVVDCRVENIYINAFQAITGTVDWVRCIASDVDDGLTTVGSATGFIGMGGKFRTRACQALNCARAGFFLADAGSAHSEIDGYVYRCGFGVQGGLGGATLGSHGRILDLFVEDTHNHAVLLVDVFDWTINKLHTQDISLTTGDESAGAMQINGGGRHYVGEVRAQNTPGYVVALAAATHDNFVGTIDAYQVGDPALDISGGSDNNTIGLVRARDGSYAVVIGEGLAGSNDNNVIDTIHAIACPYGALRIDIGTFNHIGRVVSRDNYTADELVDGIYLGIVSFKWSGTTDNTVGYIDHRSTGTLPKYVVHFGSTTVRNRVLDGSAPAGTFSTARVLDSNGGNFVSPPLATAGTLRT